MASQKEQFHEKGQIYQASELLFDVPNSQLLANYSVVECNNFIAYGSANCRDPAPYGVFDPQLGATKDENCKTCHQNRVACPGHFGHIQLALPIFHTGYFTHTYNLLQMICKSCSRVLLDDRRDEQGNVVRDGNVLNSREYFRVKLDAINTSYQLKERLKKEIMAIVRKTPKVCQYCKDFNGAVKKVGFHKILHEKFKFKETSKTKTHSSINQFRTNIQMATLDSKEVRESAKSVTGYVIDAIKAWELLTAIPAEDYPLLCMNFQSSTPENLIVWTIPVSPSVIRPSVISDIRSGTNEDDLTTSLMSIIKMSNFIEKAINDGFDISGSNGQLGLWWEGLQSLHALMINSGVNLNSLPRELRQQKPPRRALVQRLKGKQGRFRQNLLGKRVNFSGRSVISPDPNLRIDQVGIPMDVARILTFPEKVTRHNMNKLKELVKNGAKWPGANEIQFEKSGDKVSLEFLKSKKMRVEKANELRCGDVVMRHLNDTDVVLFNRQPTLHRQSMMAHQVKVMKWKTFRFNECVCAPYNADFDGDEMNVHLPQTAEAKAEAMTLMGVKANTLTPRSGEPLIASIQDFITAMYLLTQKDVFFTHGEVARLVATIVPTHHSRITIPQPAIYKPCKLWTGKQVFSILLRPSRTSNEIVNLNAKAKRFKAPKQEDGRFDWDGKFLIGYKTSAPEMIPDDSWVVIRNSYLVAGTMDKSSLGSGSKKQVFYILTRDYGAESAAQAMWRMCRIGPRYLSNRGFSIGIGDVWASDKLLKRKQEVIAKQYNEVDRQIALWQSGGLKVQPGCSEEQTLENIVQKELSEIRDTSAGACFSELSRHNTPLNMALCGSKGSNINIAQMIACVGQQVLSGSRIPNGFEDRSLPHFPRKSKDPKARGFVKNSFFSGLTPTEFFFHTMGGREGLVDTAVKTAATGYMQRRLVKALEDLCCAYDGTVRNSHDEVIQFTYGQDQLDPQEMEGDSRPVDFHRIWADCAAKCSNTTSPTMPGDQINAAIERYCTEALTNKTYSATDPGFFEGYKEFITNELPTFTRKKALEVTNHWSACKIKKDKLYQPHRVIEPHLALFVRRCALKYFKSRMEPGTCVGAICATSIGEPATQMTLKTFHFAGVASMNITQGVPRIEQIINNTTKIKTPIIYGELDDSHSKEKAQEVVSKIEKTTLGEICEYIEEIHTKMHSFLVLKLDTQRIRLLRLKINAETVKYSIAESNVVKLSLAQIHIKANQVITIEEDGHNEKWRAMIPDIRESINGVLVKGLKGVNRAVINHMEGAEGQFNMIVDGADLAGVLATPGIDWKKTYSNHTPKMFECLGIEAARGTIIREMENTMGHHGIHVDQRHLMMLADYMTYRGAVHGCTRMGLSKSGNSVLALASFEKTGDVMFNAAYYGQRDALAGPSEAFIMGMPMKLGTGLFKLFQQTKVSRVLRKRDIFNDYLMTSTS